MLVFEEGGKPLGAERRTNNKLNPHIASSSRIDPKPHGWEASALTTMPSLLPTFSDLCQTDTQITFGIVILGEKTLLQMPICHTAAGQH